MPLRITKQHVRLYLMISGIFLLIWIFNFLSAYPDTAGYRIINTIWRLAYVLVLNFILFEYTIPSLSFKHWIRSILLIAAHLFFYSGGLYIWRIIGIQLHIYTSLYTPASKEHPVTDQMTFSMMSVMFFAIARHIYLYIKLIQTSQQLLIEKQQAELNYLKSQTNPHFLFNTLNNIYALTREKNDRAPESVLRLSKILRFMLYDTAGSFISVEQELKVINDYIELEKLRYDETLKISFVNDVEDMKQAIPPLLLMPMVENAFKHGLSETRHLPFIELYLSINHRQLKFFVKNSSDAEEKAIKENIGLSNLRRQLELLYKDYSLEAKQGKGIFETELKINLSSHV